MDKSRFFGAIDSLSPGNRDRNLVRVATYGIAAGLSPAEVFEAIMSGAPGGTRPDPVAVRRAIENCYGSTKPVSTEARDYPFTRFIRKTEEERLEERRRNLPDSVRATVRTLIDASRGATPDDLILNSPTPIPLDPREQASAHLRTLGADWRWKAWAGRIWRDGALMRKRGVIVEPCALAWAIESRVCPKIPSHISLNPLTGEKGLTKEGKASYDCAETVAALRFCLVEFDEMPLSDQLALWTSVVRVVKDEVPVVSIVYSGGKSLHAVILDRPADLGALARETISDADRSAHAKCWDALFRRFASSKVRSERMDVAPAKNPAIHTRVAGAVRDETGKHQTLLYLDTALAKSNLELF